MKKFGLKAKLFIGISLLSAIISFAIGFSIYKIASRIYYESFIEHKKSLIQNLAASIDGEIHKSFNTKESLANSEFRKIFNFLQDVNRREKYIRWMFTLGINKNRELAYFVDATIVPKEGIWLEGDAFAVLAYLNDKDELILEWDNVLHKDFLTTVMEGKKCEIKMFSGKEPFIEVQGIRLLTIIQKKPLVIQIHDRKLEGLETAIQTTNLPPCMTTVRYSFGSPDFSSIPGQVLEEKEDMKKIYFKVLETGNLYFPEKPTALVYGTYMNAAAPIFDSKGKTSGVLVMAISTKDIQVFKNVLAEVAMIVFTLSFIVIILFSYFLSNYFTKPLNILTNVVAEITSGHSKKRVTLNTNDEFQELGIRFNFMLENLQEAKDNSDKLNEELIKANLLKDEFLANTSHELRTPLNGIIGIAESLADGVAGVQTNQSKENLSLIISSGKRLSNLINDILDFSKLKHKELQINLQPVDIYSITNLVIKVSNPLIKNKNLQLINKITENIPFVLADENRLQQILYNIIGNAIKFTEEGFVIVNAELFDGDEIALSTEPFLKNQLIKISITDTGIGIPADKLESIFESFEQVDSSNTRQYGGTGLGLSVTKQLIELQGGEIWAESEHGNGSRFTFTLQTTQNKQQSSSKTINNDNPPKYQNSILEVGVNSNTDITMVSPKADNMIAKTDLNFSSNHILVVDDEPVNLQVISNHFTFRGYKVSTASSGKEALEFLKMNEKPDLILLDVMMPMMTGFEVCQKIREKYDLNQLPILFLTAKNSSSDLIEGFNVQGNDYIVKPFSKIELLSRVETHIKLKDKSKQIELISKVKDEFLLNLSHELKTPLTVISAYSEMLNSEKTKPEKIKKYSGMIFENAQKLKNYISDLFLVTNIESDLQVQMEIMDIQEVISKIIEQLKPLKEEKEIQLEFNPIEKINWNCDRILLEKAISAIVKNAIDYNKKEGKIKIKVFSNPLGYHKADYSSELPEGSLTKYLQIIIKDTGIGIAKEFQQKIFEKFFRVDSSLKYEVSGVGVGLFIARKLIELQGGRIELKSELGIGSEFTIELPIMKGITPFFSNEKN